MRTIVFALLGVGLSVFAQPRPGATFGRMVDTVPPPNRIAQPPGHVLAPPPMRAHPRHERTVVVPYPVYYGGYYGYVEPPPAYYDAPGPSNYNQPNYYQPNSYQPGPQESAPPPVVIINQYYRPDTANPVLHDYSNTPLPPPSQQQSPDSRAVIQDVQPTIYLIAMKDHTILPALAYWVEGDTLNYITTEGSKNRASLSLVDREFSRQLNDERHVEFNLPSNR
jgi:hypothetical protein